MLRLDSSSPSASATSSQRGQIVESELPPPPSGGSNLHPDGPPPSPPPPPGAIGSEDGELGGRTPKRPRADPSGGRNADRAPGHEDDKDRISDLPDAVLLSVLSYLPLSDAGRTAILSNRWRGLFDQSLLDFNACQPFPPEEGRGCEWMMDAVTKILAARPNVRIRSFRFVMYGRGFQARLPVVDGWFRTLPLSGVRDIDIDMFYTTPKLALPGSLLGLASLETLKLYCCRFPDTEAPPQLPALKTLDLSDVAMSQHSLQAMLSHCKSLECVKLKNIYGVEKICLRSNSLVRLYGDFAGFKEVIVEDAQNLEELVGIDLPNYGKAFVNIVSAPKLQVLGYLGINIHPLVLNDTVLDGGAVQLRTLMRSVKTLAIQVPFSEKGYTVFVSQLLKCFPCLEVLHVEPDKRSVLRSVDVEQWDTASSIQCVENSINKVVFEYFGGEFCQWGFLTFLLGMAKALKLVEFYCWRGNDWASCQVEVDLMASINKSFPDVDFMFYRIFKSVKDLYLCHCCPRQCQKEQRKVALLKAIQASHAESRPE
ncbi:hypothetical protein QOZ80_1BG0082210 [Eleusine coracana subsp. coracana]|nr:hypothetical protein QOZ80_1BG0082210 [Eleusine coracana subsp. coracana]